MDSFIKLLAEQFKDNPKLTAALANDAMRLGTSPQRLAEALNSKLMSGVESAAGVVGKGADYVQDISPDIVLESGGKQGKVPLLLPLELMAGAVGKRADAVEKVAGTMKNVKPVTSFVDAASARLEDYAKGGETSKPTPVEEEEDDDSTGFMDAIRGHMDKGKKKAARKQRRQQRRAAKKASGKEPFPAGMEEVESPSASTDYAGMPADGSAVGYNEEPAEEVTMDDMMAAYRGEEVDFGIDPDEGAFDITAGAPKAIPVAEAVYTPEQAQELFKVTHGEPFDPKAPADKKKMKEIEETLVEQGGLGDQSANQFALNIYRKYKYV